jgi:predicted DNA-binding transcriptional regulator AlpA
MNKTDIPQLLTVREVALILGLHEKVIYRFIKKGLFKDCIVRIGDTKIIRFHPVKIKKAIDDGGVS